MTIEELLQGYSYADDYIARDIILINLLVSKGIITNDEVLQVFNPKNISEWVALVRETRAAQDSEMKGGDNEAGTN